jgi:hypothetical protein
MEDPIRDILTNSNTERETYHTLRKLSKVVRMLGHAVLD